MKTRIPILLALILCLSPLLAMAAPEDSADPAAHPVVPSQPYSYVSPDKDMPYNVAIFRDVLPWGDARADSILADHGISYTVFGSNDFGAVDLEGFDKVILASAQPDTFLQKSVDNYYWFSNYVDNGGHLLTSLAQYNGAMTPGQYYPVGARFDTWALDNAPTIEQPSHPVFNEPNAIDATDLAGWGSSSHGEFTMSGGTVLAQNTNGTTNLAEWAYGFGRVVVTTLTFEYTGASYEAAENLILYQMLNPAAGRVAVFQNQLPWGSDGFLQLFHDENIPYTIFDSADMGVVDLAPYARVILMNQQPSSFIAAVMAHRGYFEAFAAAGGVLINGMAHYSSHMSGGEVYPGDVLFAEAVNSGTERILLPDVALFQTPNTVVDTDLSGSSGSHGHLEAPGATNLVASTAVPAGATLIEQAFGDGWIISTTLTMPLYSQPLMPNLMQYTPVDSPRLTSITDVGNDQGGQVRLIWSRSGHDYIGNDIEITGYEIYRRQDANKAAGWDYLATVPAHGESVYQGIMPTLCDSTIADGMCWSAFKVRATTSSSYGFFDAPVDSGWSVDNLAPAVPLNLLVAGGVLSWEESPEPDFKYYTVYGSATPGLSGATVLGHTTSPSLDASGTAYPYLMVTATDFAGNESQPAQTGGATAVGDLPQAFRLLGAAPNPFNPSTRIRFELPAASTVDVRVYDPAGRLVRELLQGETMSAGRHGADWNGRDTAGRPSAAGVYFFTVKAGADEKRGRMLLLK